MRFTQAFIFDFNGTLYPDKELHRMAWKRFMADHGVAITDEDFERDIYGPSNDAIMRHFLGEDLTQAEVARLSAQKEAIYREIALSDPSLQSLAPGAVEMLDMLKARDVPCAIATASIAENVDFYFETLRIGRWFDRRHVFFDEAGLPGKPDPAIYRLAMQKLCYSPGSVTVVEDSMSGILSAHGAGAGRIIAIDTTLGAEALCKVSQVSAVIHDFYDFERFVEE